MQMSLLSSLHEWWILVPNRVGILAIMGGSPHWHIFSGAIGVGGRGRRLFQGFWCCDMKGSRFLKQGG